MEKTIDKRPLLEKAGGHWTSFGRKNKQKRGKNLPPVHAPADYVWQILGWMCKDLDDYLPAELIDEFSAIVRSRDQSRYQQFCEKHSLTQFSHSECDLSTLRAIRMLTLAEKFMFDSDEQVRISRCYDLFLEYEQACKIANTNAFPIKDTSCDRWIFEPIIEHAKYFIKKVLGDLSLYDVVIGSRHGPGAHATTTKSRTSIFDKFARPPYSVTKEALPYARLAITTDQRWLRSLIADYLRDPRVMDVGYCPRFSIHRFFQLNVPDHEHFWSWVFDVVEANKILTVPKNSKINRDMAEEPSLNIFLQLGVDSVIRKGLRKFGIDLNDQTKNQRLAQRGSANDTLATIDLSGASNLISQTVVKELLPKEWWVLLNNLRSKVGLIKMKGMPETKIVYEKISSMGNGFTFALESLIFASLVYGITKDFGYQWREMIDHVSVYGDDIVIPQGFVTTLTHCLRRLHFKVNTKKSFTAGYIRESCGEDFYKGERIRPVYVKTIPTDIPHLVADRNGLVARFVEYFNREPYYLYNMDKWVEPHTRFYGPPQETKTDWLFSYREEDFQSEWNLDDQYDYLVLPCYQIKRYARPKPMWLRWIYGALVHPIKMTKPKPVYSLRNKVLPQGFDVVGRDAPLRFRRGIKKIHRGYEVQHALISALTSR